SRRRSRGRRAWPRPPAPATRAARPAARAWRTRAGPARPGPSRRRRGRGERPRGRGRGGGRPWLAPPSMPPMPPPRRPPVAAPGAAGSRARDAARREGAAERERVRAAGGRGPVGRRAPVALEDDGVAGVALAVHGVRPVAVLLRVAAEEHAERLLEHGDDDRV